MRAASLDRRIRTEARILVREAREAATSELEPAATEIERALADHDLQRVRRSLPQLTALVDNLDRRPAKSVIRDYAESIGAAVLLAFCVRACVLEAFKI